MELNDYQKQALTTAKYPSVYTISTGINSYNEFTDDSQEHKWVYPMLGLSSEVGELSNKLKKVIRENAPIDDNTKAELGDVLWYTAVLADSLGITLEELAAKNLEKLKSRQERGVIFGNGDNR